MSGAAYYRNWLPRNPQFVRKKAGFHGQVTQNQQLVQKKAGFYGQIAQLGVKRPRVNQDQDNATRIKSRVQNERNRLLLILVAQESTVCPEKGRNIHAWSIL